MSGRRKKRAPAREFPDAEVMKGLQLLAQPLRKAIIQGPTLPDNDEGRALRAALGWLDLQLALDAMEKMK